MNTTTMNPSTSIQAVKVAVRVRGLVPRERLQGCVQCITSDETCRTIRVGQERSFCFDHVFGPAACQRTIYEECVAPILHNCLQGLNMTVFAYGASPVNKNGLCSDGECNCKSDVY